MFVGDERRVEVSFAAAAARLASLIGGGSLVQASHAAWGEGIARVGPIGPVPGMSKLVRVRFREPVQHDASLVLTLRWEATGVSGALFPVLDADIVFVPDGDQATLIGLSGAYRPPGGTVGEGLDRAILHRVATATIRSLLAQITDAITHPAPARDGLGEASGLGVMLDRPATESL
jgi:hypothetical protein